MCMCCLFSLLLATMDFQSKIISKLIKNLGVCRSDLKNLTEHSTLMVDLVLNHCSVKNEWFIGYQNGNPMYENFFCTVDEDFDLTNIVRPRSSPLKEKFLINGEEKNIWCTFSRDQVDLNFKNPASEFSKINRCNILVHREGRASIEIRCSCIYLENFRNYRS